MEYKNLPGTKISVSKICLGTMTWGEQNTEKDGHEQLDYALSRGVNFIDTAEMYSVPGRKETQGSTERIIGNWLKNRRKRVDIILATKVTGPSQGLSYIRNVPNFSRSHILEAINGSLKRLQTDYVDLYQLHWPERKTNCFGQLMYQHDNEEQWEDNFLNVLQTLGDIVREGKVRHIGISNETPWGTMRLLYLAEKHNLPKPVSIQNPYSLLNRTFEIGLSEICHKENLAMLPYSPLGFGILSGKYLTKNKPTDTRLSLFPKLNRYSSKETELATKAYVDIANKHSISPVHLALAFVNSRSFVTSTIIGATKIEQLKENIDSILIRLNDEVLKGIEEVHKIYPFPAP
jgi:aryl-alcohol dehydrogenase-like predicted oxidoreductase